MPAKKRVKPVVEEVVEEAPQEEAPLASTAPSNPVVEEEAPAAQSTLDPVEQVQEDVSEAVVEMSSDDSSEKAVVENIDGPEKKINLKMIIIITLVSALVAALVSGGVYVYLSGVNKLKSQPASTESSPSPSPEASSQATPTPEASSSAELKLDTYKIRVLNGSGEIGAAGSAQKAIESGGFKVTSTGNASSYDFENTLIQAKKSIPEEVVNKLKDALSNDYSVEIGDTLADTEKLDIIVTVGSK